MNILLVAPFRPIGIGGLGSVVKPLQDSLNLRGHPALLLASGDTDHVAPVPGGGRDFVYGIYLRRMYRKGLALKAFTAFWVYLPVTLYHLYSFLREQRIQIIHLHFPVPLYLYFCLLSLFGRWKLVATFHGTDVYALPKRTRFYRFLLGVILSRVDMVTAVSADALRFLKNVYPRLRFRSRVILNGNPISVPPAAGPLPEPLPGMPESYILAVGSLVPQKGYDILLKSIRLVRDKGYDVNLMIVGGGQEAANLAALARELCVQDRVFFAGEIPHHQVIQVYLRAKYVVHAARQEGFGLVLVEAMSCRKAVIAARVGGIPEFVRDGVTGFLVNAEDPEALAAAIIRLENDEALRVSLAARGFEFVVREHTWERMTEQYIETYETVVRDAS